MTISHHVYARSSSSTDESHRCSRDQSGPPAERLVNTEKIFECIPKALPLAMPPELKCSPLLLRNSGLQATSNRLMIIMPYCKVKCPGGNRLTHSRNRIEFVVCAKADRNWGKASGLLVGLDGQKSRSADIIKRRCRRTWNRGHGT